MVINLFIIFVKRFCAVIYFEIFVVFVVEVLEEVVVVSLVVVGAEGTHAS